MEWEDEWTGNTKRDKAGNNYFESTLQYLGKGKVLNRFVSESLLNPAWIQVIDISCFQGLFFLGYLIKLRSTAFPTDRVIGNGTMDPTSTEQHQGFDVMDPMFLFVGRLAVQKGPDLLLEAPMELGRMMVDGWRPSFVFGAILDTTKI